MQPLNIVQIKIGIEILSLRVFLMQNFFDVLPNPKVLFQRKVNAILWCDVCLSWKSKTRADIYLIRII